MKNTVLIIGTFEMPDKDAAAIRVTGIAMSLTNAGYQVILQGRNKAEKLEYHQLYSFQYKDRPRWSKAGYYSDIQYVIDTINEIGVDEVVAIIAYHYPAIAMMKLLKYCNRAGIKLISDNTEWYQYKLLTSGGNKEWEYANFLLRMKWANIKVKNIIAISRFLFDYYQSKDCNVVRIPILSFDNSNNRLLPRTWSSIRLVYCGSPAKKDNLLPLVQAVSSLSSEYDVELRLVGISKDQFETFYNYRIPEANNDNIIFFGRVPHEQALRILQVNDFSIIIRPKERYAIAGFPTKMVEAFSNGLGVIATPVGDLREHVIDGKTGFLLKDDSKESLEALLKKICLMTSQELSQIKENSYNLALERFDYKKYSVILKAFIDRCK